MSKYGYCPKCGAEVTTPDVRFQTPDSKYNIAFDQGGKPVLVNAASGKEIEEPIFILRAQDKGAVRALMACVDRN